MTYLEAETMGRSQPLPKKYFWQRMLWKINKSLAGPPAPIAKHALCHCGRFFCGKIDH